VGDQHRSWSSCFGGWQQAHRIVRSLHLKIAGTSTGTDTGIVLNHINSGGTQAIVANVTGVQSSIQNANLDYFLVNLELPSASLPVLAKDARTGHL